MFHDLEQKQASRQPLKDRIQAYNQNPASYLNPYNQAEVTCSPSVNFEAFSNHTKKVSSVPSYQKEEKQFNGLRQSGGVHVWDGAKIKELKTKAQQKILD